MPNWFPAKGVLYINPTEVEEPVVDELALTVAALLLTASAKENRAQQCGGYDLESKIFAPRIGFRGTHQCYCGANSTTNDYYLGTLENGTPLVTNWLAVHYLVCHRSATTPDLDLLLELIAYIGAQPMDDSPQFRDLTLIPARG